MLMSESNAPTVVTFSAIPLILPLPFNVTLPIPFGVKFKSMFVSLPVTETFGAPVVAALATVISFTAEAVFENLMYAHYPESSSIAPVAVSITMSLPFVSNTADNCGA
jgi:hypothetical protein